MTEEETTDLLTYMASFDKRTVGDADIDAWAPIMRDLPFPDAMEAVGRHYGRDSTEFMKPKHVRDGVKAIRTERISRSVIPAPPPELCDNPRAYLEHLRGATRQAADGQGIPATGQPPVIVGDNQRLQFPVNKDLPTLRHGIAGIRRELTRPRPAAVPDERRALEQAELARAERKAREAAAEHASDEPGQEAS